MTGSDQESEYLVEMDGITVRFPGVLALDNVTFRARSGTVHVLLGENGAGKSTIMKVLAGVYTDYEGRIRFKSADIVSRSIEEQRGRGVSIIFQEMNLLKNLSVAENIFLGRQPTKTTGGIDWTEMYRRARSLLDSIRSDISEHALVSSLSVGQMQMVEIAKALSFDSDIIIMDEPTSALTEKEVDALFAIIRKLREDGVAIVYISHRLDEILRIGDWVTVLRDGKNVDTVPVKGLTTDRMVAMMVGREMTEYYPKVEVEPGQVMLETQDLVKEEVLKKVSFQARAGEITGLYGLMGAGRTELLRCVFGADPFDSGAVIVKGKRTQIRSCRQAKQLGMALLTEDRKNQGLILSFDVKTNITLANLSSIMARCGLSRAREDSLAQSLVDKVRVKTPSLRQIVNNLSGGNQQKVVICKWLNTTADIVIFDEPTRGIDVGSKVEIYRIMNTLKEAGKAVVVATSELTECMGISDRIYVMHEGEVTGQIEKTDMADLTEEKIMSYATGSIRNVPERL